MAFVAIPGCAQVRINMRLDNQRVQNTLAFRQEPFQPDMTAFDLAGLAQGVGVWVEVELFQWLSQELTLFSVEAVDLSSQFAETGTYSPTAQIPGTVTGSCAPSNVALCIQFKSAARGRRARGRNYITGLPNLSIIAPNRYQPAALANLQSAYENIDVVLADYTSPDWRQVIASRADGIGVMYDVTERSFRDDVLDSQRRRLPGRGD